MPGRHAAGPSRSQRRRVGLRFGRARLAATSGAVLLLGATGFSVAAERGLICAEETRLTLAASPEIAPVVTQAVAQRGPGAFGCARLQVAWTDPDDVLASVHSGQEVPDLWIPDTSAWLSRLPSSRAGRPHWPVATTPVVLAGPAGAGRPTSWLGALSAPGAELLDPRASGASVGALSALHAEAREGDTSLGALSRWLVARARAAPAYSLSDEDLLNNAGNGGDAAPTWFPTTEQQFIDHADEIQGSGVAAAVPRSGTAMMDYPLTALATDADADAAVEAARALAEHLRSEEGTRQLVEGGFRPVSGRALAAEGSVGTVPQAGVAQPAAVGRLLRSWVTLTTDARLLAVLDVSGSMYDQAGAHTRIELARDAMLTAMRSVPDGWHLGLWAFSHGLGPRESDHRMLAPVRPLHAIAGGTTHRAALTRATRALPEIVGGGTGLYDTTLAAYRAAIAGYKPGRLNSIVLLTDGRNDDPGGHTLTGLLAALHQAKDPRRPVQVITVGMGPDTDPAALRRIATATGGASYVARDAGAVAQILDDALLERVGWNFE
jgi:Bacterial extracellular solute-binding protein/von Willebrand factor type A domain